MNVEKLMKSSGAFGERTCQTGMFKSLDATELYCPKKNANARACP